ncbi:hypothetical protein [Elizabethkingia meningoseptica]|uniref:hypothetical protein n=1 Tax=Elizabethkingia meningoseptica TaxID=238 RepID=UPI0023B0EDC7|nr:hypothetical protein [Elizabethkingia meningoseptica]MDE5493457.1 hypothetical protein [Elizabethkingia meningoseptica]
MRKRQIIVPLTEEAIARLESDSSNEIDQIIYNINENDFLILFHSNLFNIITQNYSDIIIDDFEEENINDKTILENIIILIREKEGIIPKILVDRLVFLFEQTILCKTGIYFYF